MNTTFTQGFQAELVLANGTTQILSEQTYGIFGSVQKINDFIASNSITMVGNRIQKNELKVVAIQIVRLGKVLVTFGTGKPVTMEMLDKAGKY